MGRLRISDAAKRAIDNTPLIKLDLGMAVGVSEASINRYLRDFETDDNLTKAAAIYIIRDRTGLSLDEILVEMTLNPSYGSKEAIRIRKK